MPIVLVLCSVYSQFMQDTRFVLYALQPSPLLQKCVTSQSSQNRNQICFLCQHGFIQHAVQLQISRPLIALFQRYCVGSPVSETSKKCPKFQSTEKLLRILYLQFASHLPFLRIRLSVHDQTGLLPVNASNGLDTLCYYTKLLALVHAGPTPPRTSFLYDCSLALWFSC